MHGFCEGWILGGSWDDLGCFVTEGGDGFDAGVVGEEGGNQSCEGCR